MRVERSEILIAEIGELMSENRCQKTEVGKQKADDREQMTEVGGLKTESLFRPEIG